MGRLSRSFEFEKRNQVFLDEDLRVEFHISQVKGLPCPLCDRSTVCLHSRCREFLFYPISPPFISATTYSFVPPAAEERRRFRHFQWALVRNLHRSDLGPKLPAELWGMVAEYLVRDCAALTAQEQVRQRCKTGDYDLDLTRPVYAYSRHFF